MKKFLRNSMALVVLATALVFTSCQDEFEQLPDGNESETFMAGSTTAKLMASTSTRDGSFDNIVDGASCFDIKFPYTVDVNGITITIDSEEDLEVIEEIFDALDTDLDILEIFFPITITLGDHTEIVIENQEELLAFARECIEGGDDDDIECVDFVYPITLYTFDVNNQQTGSVTVNSDKELRRFLAGLDDDDLISIDFPVTLILYDGSEVQANSNAELASILEMAKDACDEDDDNDYNDDDFTKERLDNLLVECPWLVKEIERDFISATDQYFEYLFTFGEDGSVVVKDRAGNVLNGTWSTRVTDHRVLLKLEFDILVDFNLEWFVYEIKPGRIKLFSGEGNKIVMESVCDIFEDDPNTLREILKECVWVIKKVKNQGVEIDRLLGWEFQFMAEGVVTLSNGVSTSNGTWEIATNAQGRLVMALSFGSDPEINFEWPLRDLANDRLKFEIDEIDYELVLQRVCDDNNNDGDVVWIRNIMMEGEWVVAHYSEDEMDMTDQFNDFTFDFMAEHQASATVGVMGPSYPGLWRVLRNSEGMLKVYLNFGSDQETLAELTDDWKLESVSETRIELVDISSDSNTGATTGVDRVVFERK